METDGREKQEPRTFLLRLWSLLPFSQVIWMLNKQINTQFILPVEIGDFLMQELIVTFDFGDHTLVLVHFLQLICRHTAHRCIPLLRTRLKTIQSGCWRQCGGVQCGLICVYLGLEDGGQLRGLALADFVEVTTHFELRVVDGDELGIQVLQVQTGNVLVLCLHRRLLQNYYTPIITTLFPIIILSSMEATNTSSTAFTDHLQKTQKVEMKLLQNFRYRFPDQPTPAEEGQERLARTPFKEKTFVEKQEERGHMQEYNLRIDDSAFVVGGKLVYLKDEGADLREDKRRLMMLLKENKISYKKYMMGKQGEYLSAVATHQKEKEERVVNDYIKKYINMEKNTRIETSNNYQNTKQQLFLTK